MNVTGPQSTRSLQMSAKRAPGADLAAGLGNRSSTMRSKTPRRRATSSSTPSGCSLSAVRIASRSRAGDAVRGSGRRVLRVLILQGLDRLEALEFRMTKVQRFVVAGVAVRGAKLFGPRPVLKRFLVRPHRMG